jgi:SNF2 family DNA or RNA helicase
VTTTLAPPTVLIASRGATQIVVTRGQNVPDVFWTRLLAEWGIGGADPAAQISVPVERFLSKLEWLPSSCRRFGVSLGWDDGARNFVRAVRAERAVLDQASRATPLSSEAVRARLDGGRFTRELRDFQVRDLRKLLALPHGANFSVPGAGKTTVAYALYEAERLSGKVTRLLVVAPLSAYDAWMAEARDCFSEAPVVHRYDGGLIPLDTEVCLVNYQRLSSAYEHIARWVSDCPCHAILDEAHRMKRGRAGEWGKSTLNLAYLAIRRDVLTGTPAPQSIRDLEALLDFAWPGQARRILPEEVFRGPPTEEVTGAVATAVRPFFVRTTKSDLQLTAPQYRVLLVPLEGLQREIYEALRNQYAGQFSITRRDRIDFARMGEVVMYLLEAATNPQLLNAGASEYDVVGFRYPAVAIAAGSALADLLARYSSIETPRKFVELARIVRANADLGRKTLIWTNFVRNITALETAFALYNPAVIHGGIPSEISQPNAPRKREDELLKFRNSDDCLVLLANPAATSEGVSLHLHCHDAIYLDRTFNAGQYLQSVDRIHRLGMPQDQDTRITFLVTDGTIDQSVDNRIREKAERLGAILEDNDIATIALPNDEDYGRVIENDADLAELFRHIRGGT